MPLVSELTVRAVLDQTSPLDLATAAAPLDYMARIRLLSGTGAGAADMAWHDQRTVAASGNEDLDLAGVLTGPLGGTLTFARIKGLIFKAADANVNNVQVTRPAANGVPWLLAAGDGIALAPGEVFAWLSPTATGKAVTAGTADLINVANSGAGTGVTYDVIIIGASA